MKNVHLLDCTLRDGGFVNNWMFGEDTIVDIIKRLDYAKIDIVEVGYLRDYIEYNINETQFPNTECVDYIVPKESLNKSMIVAIIDYGDCTIDNISPCNESVLDGIRVTFKKKNIDEAMEFCRKIKNLGYKVFAQPVSFMDYSYQEILNLIEKINTLEPYAVSIVDTYGFMDQTDLIHRVNIIDDTLQDNIVLGYHSHNNFQLAYSNAIAMLALQTKREMIIDCSILGMGKGAGNTNTELMAIHLNNFWGKNYNIDQLIEIADLYIEKERSKTYWGYSLKYYLAATNQCHHKYIDFLLKKKCLSIQAINYIVANIDKNKLTAYDESHITELYNNYQKKVIVDESDYKEMKGVFGGKQILILAPGSSIETEKDLVQKYIEEYSPIIIAVNFMPEKYNPDYIFISNANRFSQVMLKRDRLNVQPNLIVTSNVDTMNLEITYRLNYSDLVFPETLISDNSVLLLLKALEKMDVSTIAIAGFDGYIDGKKNYVKDELEFLNEYDIRKKNVLIAEKVDVFNNTMPLKFITKSRYLEKEVHYEI